MKVLVGCEESQEVTKQLRALGHEAYSCDLVECSGGHPFWHIQMDIFDAIRLDNWDMLIAFPPCTDLSKAGGHLWKEKLADGRQMLAVDFVKRIARSPIEKIAIENPVGALTKYWRKPDQIIEPYMFGDPYKKSTCLWLKNLPLLKATHRGVLRQRWVQDVPGDSHQKRIRSKTFTGVAKAMASQWTNISIHQLKLDL